MDSTFRERLRSEYLQWDRLGRGETQWQGPVVPEPHFIPFLGHGERLRRENLADDGRVDTGLSSLFRILRKPKPAVVEPESPFAVFDEGEPPDRLRDESTSLAEAVWTVPDDVRWRPAEFEPFLFALGAAERPVCFEILGTKGSVHLQWAAHPRDAGVVTSAVELLPFVSSLEWRDDHLGPLVCESPLSHLWTGDLALAREFAFPLATESAGDPLGELLRQLSEFGHETLALVQVRFQPCERPWAESLWRLVTDEAGQPFFADGRRFLDAVKSKCRKPLFAVNVRLAVMADADETSAECARRLVRSFCQFDGGNSLKLADGAKPSRQEALGLIAARSWHRSGMVLGGAELLGLVHPPASGAGAPALGRLRRRTWPVPSAYSQGFDLELGTCRHGGSATPCGLGIHDRLRHVHVLGASGSGKSTFLLNSILQDLDAGHGLAVLDPHGDLVDAILDRLPESRVPDLVLFDPADAAWPVGFNILRAHTEVERNLLASDFVAIFERLSSSWGDQMTAVLGNAAMAFLESTEGGTLVDLKRFLIEKPYRERFLRTVQDPEVRYFWTHEFPILRGTTQASLLTRLNGFLRHRLIRNMVAQRGERFDVGRMMDEGKIILAPLSQGLIGHENSWLLGSLLVSKLHQAALSRQAMVESERRPFFLYLDEAHNFVTPSIAAILSGARKYGLGLILAHQELDQFPARESGVLSSILSNCNTRVYFQLGDKDSRRLEDGFSHFDADCLRRLKVGEAICRVGGSDGDFSLDCPPLPPQPADAERRRSEAVERSRVTYALPRGQIENGDAADPEETAPPEAAPKRRRSTAVEVEASVASRDGPPAVAPPSKEPEAAASPAPTEPQAAAPALGPGARTDPPPKSTPRTPGRGGSLHKAIQQAIKQHANGLGLRATVEGGSPGSPVDVLVEGSGVLVAFEVAARSPLGQETKNIRKSLDAGIREVVVVSADPAHLAEVREAAESLMQPAELAGVSFVALDDLGAVFAGIGARIASTKTRSRGYSVRVNYKALPEGKGDQRRAEIHRAVADRHSAGGASDGPDSAAPDGGPAIPPKQ